jgi:hypothetical protein
VERRKGMAATRATAPIGRAWAAVHRPVRANSDSLRVATGVKARLFGGSEPTRGTDVAEGGSQSAREATESKPHAGRRCVPALRRWCDRSQRRNTLYQAVTAPPRTPAASADWP